MTKKERGYLTEFYYFALSFFVYGFLGWCTEVAYAAVKQGKFVNRGFLNGPICPVYGIGVGVVVQFLTPVENNLVLLYISSTILVTAIEGITGFLLEKIFHNKWWDYSDQPLNIGGYVCVLFSLIWGVFCVLIVKVIHPLIYNDSICSWNYSYGMSGCRTSGRPVCNSFRYSEDEPQT